jgi:hypothetical protein
MTTCLHLDYTYINCNYFTSCGAFNHEDIRVMSHLIEEPWNCLYPHSDLGKIMNVGVYFPCFFRK